ncbi:hypothetical protein GBA52_001859 [Prunus armeniaca]|nr:hypothetical protein GBA52_001859 [Prunus armeniaca]
MISYIGLRMDPYLITRFHTDWSIRNTNHRKWDLQLRRLSSNSTSSEQSKGSNTFKRRLHLALTTPPSPPRAFSLTQMSSSSSFSLHKPSATASSSAAFSSCSVSVLKQDRGGSCEQAPGRLMRQRKLRYLSNLDLSFSSSSLTSPEHSSPLPLTESPVIGRSNSVHTYRYLDPAFISF